MNVLLLSAYDADSHKRWRRGLVSALPHWQWTQLTLPPRFFSWRVRGNSLSWGRGEAREQLAQSWDLVIATSMVDLAALRGLVPALAQVPTAVYFHENQFDYPRSEDAVASVEPQILNIYTALCADLVLFNSEYNRNTMLEGAGELLNRLPDAVPPGICDEIAQKSSVLPVPLESTVFEVQQARPSRPTFIWNHRWEYDKGPDILLAALRRFGRAEIPFTCHVVGQQFRRQPPEFVQIRRLLENLGALGAWGYQAELSEYRRLLGESHGVISTARHDFQGLSVLEAVAAGCQPLTPDSLAYPEWFGEGGWRYGDDVASCAAGLSTAMLDCAGRVQGNQPLDVPEVRRLSWTALADVYEARLRSCAEQKVR
ncbi:tRNA-queuosine alpha-mannosyltransferase domain-containing protein [Microbulbifer elongatus]|uniref:tRNA-queuosine alpha-mannosyltransferase domain-containing protein n=1 Tax=Microbulbifer elongatus TaxID=86173 RepID=UPI00210A48DF|nr:DUF3524 domain-containing protein [Microbulbifer elongatus]